MAWALVDARSESLVRSSARRVDARVASSAGGRDAVVRAPSRVERRAVRASCSWVREACSSEVRVGSARRRV